MSYTYSQAQEGESLVDTSLDTQLSQQLKSNHIAKQSCDSDKQTGYYLPSLFSETSESLTAPSGGGMSMSCAGGFLVRTFHRLVEGLGLQGKGRAFGEKWRELSVKYNPDTHSWKTHQCSLLEGLDEFSETWPKWGMMQNGVCWERIIAAHPTEETESGSWPPPNARDWKDSTAKSSINAIHGGHQMTLGRAVHMWPTPAANDNRDRGHLGMPSIQRRQAKGKQIMLSMSVSDTSGALNPDWTEWLMGWPIGQSDLKPLETDKFQSWQQQHGGF